MKLKLEVQVMSSWCENVTDNIDVQWAPVMTKYHFISFWSKGKYRMNLNYLGAIFLSKTEPCQNSTI